MYLGCLFCAVCDGSPCTLPTTCKGRPTSLSFLICDTEYFPSRFGHLILGTHKSYSMIDEFSNWELTVHVILIAIFYLEQLFVFQKLRLFSKQGTEYKHTIVKYG